MKYFASFNLASGTTYRVGEFITSDSALEAARKAKKVHGADEQCVDPVSISVTEAIDFGTTRVYDFGNVRPLK